MKIEKFFPGFVKKSITFTIDDGFVPMDRKFLSIVEHAGLRGTFNLCSNILGYLTAAGYRAFYNCHEIANHAKYHCSAIREDLEYVYSDALRPETGADKGTLYATEVPGVYNGFICRDYWCYQANSPVYEKMAELGRVELEEVFGKGSVKGFVWPNGQRKNGPVFEGMKNAGYYGLRKTGEVMDSTGYSLPADRMTWSYNTNCLHLLALAEKYEEYPDDGELKFFCFGVHSHDFECEGKWDDLVEFCDRYGNRPESYYYAPVGEIFAYEDAMNELKVSEREIVNNSDIDLFLSVDGRRVRVNANNTYVLGE